MQIIIGFIIAACLFAGFHPIRQIPKDEINLDVGAQAPVPIDVKVTPLSEFMDRNIVKQEYDYSCGSAALATLLDYYLGENFSENQVIQGLLEYGDKAKINERRAFSLLDMKRFVNKLGYRGVGYKAEMKDLLELGKPCIIPIELMGYRHFTIMRGIHDRHIFLADPFRGNTSYTLSEFKKMWFQNVIFVVYPEGAKEFSALKLKDGDLRYIDEDSTEELLLHYGPKISYPKEHERNFFFTLPDEYNKYSPD